MCLCNMQSILPPKYKIEVFIFMHKILPSKVMKSIQQIMTSIIKNKQNIRVIYVTVISLLFPTCTLFYKPICLTVLENDIKHISSSGSLSTFEATIKECSGLQTIQLRRPYSADCRDHLLPSSIQPGRPVFKKGIKYKKRSRAIVVYRIGTCCLQLSLQMLSKSSCSQCSAGLVEITEVISWMLMSKLWL